MHAILNSCIAWADVPVHDMHLSSSLTEPICTFSGGMRFLKSSPEAVENPFDMSCPPASFTDLKLAVVSRFRWWVELVWEPSESPLIGPVRLIRSIVIRSAYLVLERLMESWWRAVLNIEFSGDPKLSSGTFCFLFEATSFIWSLSSSS